MAIPENVQAAATTALLIIWITGPVLCTLSSSESQFIRLPGHSLHFFPHYPVMTLKVSYIARRKVQYTRTHTLRTVAVNWFCGAPTIKWYKM